MAGFRAPGGSEKQPSRFLRIRSMRAVSFALVCLVEARHLLSHFLNFTERFYRVSGGSEPLILDF